MRLLTVSFMGLCAILLGQSAGTSQDWRKVLRGLPERPSANTSVGDIQRFEDNVRLAAPHLAVPQAGNVEANREMVRRMWTYLAAMDVIARTPGVGRELGLAVGRARGTVMGLGLAYPYWLTGPVGSQPSPEPAPPPVKPGQPPFSLQAPDLGEVPPAEHATADDLTARYENAATRAAAAWQSADVLSQSLAARSMTLNTRVTESMIRLQMYLEMASGDLRRRDWKAARRNIERVEYVTGQVTSSVGR